MDHRPGPWVPLATALILAACASASSRWIGPLTSDNPACPATRGVALLRGGAITFAPDEGTWVLTGTAMPGGKVEASKDRPLPHNASYATSLDATITATGLDGTYTTPRCRYTVALKPY